jgi:hypothetical protein
MNTSTNTTQSIALQNFQLLPVVLTAFSTIATLLCVFFAAYHFATRPSIYSKEGPTLPPSILKKIATLSTTCFLPSLMFVNLTKAVDLEALSSLWVLPTVAVAQLLCGLLVGKIVIRASHLLPCTTCRVPAFFKSSFTAGSMFGNSAQLPLVVGYALCSQQPMSTVPNAFARYSAANFVYLIGWSACFWTVGYILLKGEGDEDHNTDNDPKRLTEMNTNPMNTDPMNTDSSTGTIVAQQPTCCGSVALRRTCNMANLATVCGITIGLIPGGKEVLFDDSGPLRFLGSGFEILSQPAVSLMTVIVFANLSRQVWLQRHAKPTNSNGHATNDEIKEHETITWQIALLFAFTRIVIIGSLQLGLTTLLLYVLPASSRLGMPERLLLLVECFSPSANLVIVVSQQVGNARGAQALSTGYMIQYLMYVPMLVAGASIGIYVAHTTNV